MSMLTSYIPSLPSHGPSVHVSCAPTLVPPWFPAAAAVEPHFPSSALLAFPETDRLMLPSLVKGPTEPRSQVTIMTRWQGSRVQISPSPQSPSALQQVLHVPCVPGVL